MPATCFGLYMVILRENLKKDTIMTVFITDVHIGGQEYNVSIKFTKPI